MVGLTVTVNAAVVAHCPAVGVNVYVVVAVLFNTGDQLPVIGVALVDDVGSGDNIAPEQIGAIALNVGVVAGRTVIILDAVIVLLHASVKVHVSVIFPPLGPGGEVCVDVT